MTPSEHHACLGEGEDSAKNEDASGRQSEETHLGGVTKALASSKGTSQASALAASLLPSQPGRGDTRSTGFWLLHCGHSRAALLPCKAPLEKLSVPSTKACPGVGLLCRMMIHSFLGIPPHLDVENDSKSQLSDGKKSFPQNLTEPCQVGSRTAQQSASTSW